jgi:endonuclease YncB( thermonuclease family)
MPQRSAKALLCYLMRFVLLCGFVCLAGANVRAASLYGKVIEVKSGDVITIFNLNRPVRVKLLAVDAPELSQEFGDVAHKHLSDLILEKSVLVEYWGIAADRSLVGRVLLNGADIGAQMIRDGVAWFDPHNQIQLSVSDREIYQQSELVARNERRGLWQQENPTAPWEFVKAEAVKRYPGFSLNAPDYSARARRSGSDTELTNLTIMTAGVNAPGRRYSTQPEINAAWVSLTASNKKLHELRPAGQNFSVLVPEEGRQIAVPIPFGDEMVDLDMHIARDGANVYAVYWLTGPSYGETDKTAMEEMVLKFIKGFHQGYERADRGYFFCGKQRERDVSMNGYVGRDFDLSTCSLPTRARAFTKVVDGKRQMYVGIVFYGDDDANVTQFIKSFTAGPKKAQTTQK